jgi:hypothetical protein
MEPGINRTVLTTKFVLKDALLMEFQKATGAVSMELKLKASP